MRPIRNYSFLFGLILLISCNSKPSYKSEILAEELETYVSYLASDSLQGRFPGTVGDSLAASYIRNYFQDLGWEMIAENGLQSFPIASDIRLGNSNYLEYMGYEAELEKDYVPYSFSSNDDVEVPLVFAGYGISMENEKLSWNDYERLDVKAKWVLVLSGLPPIKESRFLQDFSDVRSKVYTAKDQGALGIIVVAMDDADMAFKDIKQSGEDIPVLKMSREYGEAMMDKSGLKLNAYIESVRMGNAVYGLPLQGALKVRVHLNKKTNSTHNVVAFLPGSDEALKNEVIVIGGHYDHLGLGGPGTGSRAPDTVAVHYGADDNASGVAGFMEVAGALTAKKKEIKRSVLMLAFGAEEMGLLGSKYFVENFPLENHEIVAMINLDMIGRLRPEKTLSIGGTGTSLEGENILDSISKNYDFEMAYSKEGYGPSDHASFYGKNIPVFFISTGAHLDYHTPEDKVEKLNFAGMASVSAFVNDLTWSLAQRDVKLSFQESGPKVNTSTRMNLKVTLGIMPDFTSQKNDGLGVDFVTPGKPADLGGMKKGDKIIGLNGNKISNIQEYMFRLKELKAGQTITVEVFRDGKNEVLLIQL